MSKMDEIYLSVTAVASDTVFLVGHKVVKTPLY